MHAYVVVYVCVCVCDNDNEFASWIVWMDTVEKMDVDGDCGMDVKAELRVMECGVDVIAAVGRGRSAQWREEMESIKQEKRHLKQRGQLMREDGARRG